MKRKLERFKGLDGALLKKLASASVLTAEHLLSRSVVELVQGCGITQEDARDAVKTVSEIVAPAYAAVSNIVNR